jgi:predicted MPP superfamily phosphohydrolase
MIRPWMTPSHLQEIVDATNRENPDIILLLGDYVATHPFGQQLNPDEGLAPLKNLSAPCGVYAVNGNHDLHRSKGWPDALVKMKIPVLQNQVMSVSCEGRNFWIAGLEELWWQNTDVAKTMVQVTNADPVIMMMHNPDSFPEIPTRVAISVAGHTHGGQIQLPFIGAVPFVVPSRFGTRYLHGHIVEDGKDYAVTSGLGMTALPLRFLVPPEVMVVTLKREK